MNGEEINLQSEHKECRPENNHYRMKSAEHVPLFLILLFFHEVKQKQNKTSPYFTKHTDHEVTIA